MRKTAIFQPLKVGPITLKNRIEVAPAAPFLAGHDSSVTPEFFAYTCELARSGAGVVTIGVTGVEPSRPMGGRTLNLGNPAYISDLADMAEGIHRFGAAASIEMVHSRFMLSPPEKVVNETTTEEVEEVIRLFASAASLAQRAGFDMVLIHGGHGNVPSMFFNAKYNRRTDRFGGSFAGRCRFPIELCRAVREATGGKLAIEYRISAEEILPGMTTFEETLAFAKELEPYIDMLHVSRGLLEEDSLLPVINAPVYLPRGANIPFAAEFKKELKIPVCVVGSMDLDLAEEAVASGKADMAAMIRTIYADRRCVEKARKGQDDDIRPCIRCNTCISRTHSQFKTVRCAVNPLVGRDTWFRTDVPAAVRKQVAIIGGGPAGLEAARVCASRGHRVTIYEKSAELGGKFRMACAAEFKQEMRKYLNWSIRSVLRNERITVLTNTEATPDLIAEERPDVVLLAAGAAPILPAFTAAGTPKLVWVGDAEEDPALTGQRVAVCGGGMTGMEFALSMARLGKEVTIVDMLPEDMLGAGGSAINLIAIKDLLRQEGVRFVCGDPIEDIDEQGVHLKTAGGRKTVACDTAVMSLGFRPDHSLTEEYEMVCPTVLEIGDNRRPGNIWNATATAFDAAMEL